MLIDGRNIPEYQQLKTEICIVGAGPAGITIAREFINTKFEVILIESGGLKFDSKLQSLSSADVSSSNKSNLKYARRRQIGGNSHVWNAPIDRNTPGWRCLPLEPLDFESRQWIPNSGWALKNEQIEPYYSRAHQMCGLEEIDYAFKNWQNYKFTSLFSHSNNLRNTISQYGNSSIFTRDYPSQIQNAANITTLIYSTVVNIETNSSGRKIVNLEVSSIRGNKFNIAAQKIVLAAGGIENARQLLLSNQQQPLGLGNQYDLVGRFFMDHPQIELGLFIPFSRQLLNHSQLYDIHSVNQASVLGAMSLKTELIIQKQLPNHAIHFYPTYHNYLAAAKDSLELIVDDLVKAKVPQDLCKRIEFMVRGRDYFKHALFWKTKRVLFNKNLGKWSFLPNEKSRFSALKLICQLEQIPLSSNRIILTSERDLLGQNKISLLWRLNNWEINSLYKIVEEIEQELNQSKIGYFARFELPTSWDFNHVSGFHHLGTTRMHVDAKYGVVDSNCKVHGISNLYVAGSSVFPTGGYANPTLTIIALAIRLADEIKQEYCKISH